MRRRARLLAAIAAGALVVAGCSDGQVERGDGGSGDTGYIAGDGVISTIAPADREPAPDFTAPLLGEEGEFDLAAAEGDVVVINVWGSWCAPCRKEAPGLQTVYEELEADGVQFVGANTKDTERQAEAFEAEFGITYPSVFDPSGTALLAFRDTLPPAAIPSTIVVDRLGQLAARIIGPIGEASLRDIVSDIAAEDLTASYA